MKSGYTHIAMVIDKSGSMGLIADDIVGGFNTFLKEQKQLPGEATMSIMLFDTNILKLVEWDHIQAVRELDSKSYLPGGITALLDAVGTTIVSLGGRLGRMAEAERPEKLVFCIITDGQENASHEYSKAQIKEMIQHQEGTYQWEFLFLGANQDAFAESGGLGIRGQGTVNFCATDQSVLQAYSLVGQSVGTARRGGSAYDVLSKVDTVDADGNVVKSE